jgi:hypothetical protein
MTARVLITGSRTWSDWATIRTALSHIQREYGGDVIIVHGDARGADRMAGRIATELGMKEEHHPADWERYGKRAGFVRNAEMVDSGIDRCVAFIREGSRGATMCADLADKRGIPTVRYIA